MSDDNIKQRRNVSLPRGEQVYDWWGEHHSLYRLFSPADDRYPAIDRLGLDRGETVLEVGCGPGVNFERLHDEIGPDGLLFGFDYSDGMVQQAAHEIREHQWSNVHVARADATRSCITSGVFDAAIAMLVLNAMANPRQAIETVYDALRPDGRFVVLGTSEFDNWPATALNPLLRRIWSYAFDYHPSQNVVVELRTIFENVAVLEKSNTGFGYIAIAHKKNNATE